MKVSFALPRSGKSVFLVHNLMIDKNHTFAVGPNALLVHNMG